MTPVLTRVGEVAVHTYGRGVRTYVGYHGWSGSHRSLEPLVPHLPREARLIAPDLPGFGQSAAPSAWSLERYLDRLDAVFDALDLTDVTVIGNCAGAVLAMEQALRNPGRMERLVLIDPFAYVPWYFRVLTVPLLGWWFYRAAFANPLGRVMTNAALRSKRTEQTDLTLDFHRVDHRNALCYLRMLCSLGPYRRYGAIELPVSLLYGERTFQAIRRSVTLLQAQWARSRSAVLPGAGHLPIQESTDTLAAHAFVGALAPGAS